MYHGLKYICATTCALLIAYTCLILVGTVVFGDTDIETMIITGNTLSYNMLMGVGILVSVIAYVSLLGVVEGNLSITVFAAVMLTSLSTFATYSIVEDSAKSNPMIWFSICSYLSTSSMFYYAVQIKQQQKKQKAREGIYYY